MMKRLRTETKVLVLCLAFLPVAYAQGIVRQDLRIERNHCGLNANRRTAQIGEAATVILIVNTVYRTNRQCVVVCFIRQDVVTIVHVLAKAFNWGTIYLGAVKID